MNKYRCVFLMGLENALEYRMDFLLSLLSTLFPIVVQTFLWRYLYADPASSGFTGYSYSQILFYTLSASMVSQFVHTGFEYSINQDIKDGGLQKYLIRPVRYSLYQFCSFFGKKAPASILLFGFLGAELLLSFFFLKLDVTLLRIVWFLLCLVLALALNFFLFYCVALSSFWFTDVSKLFGTISVVIVVISGGVFPMDIFGPLASRLSALLPFGYTTQFPVNVLSGKLDLSAALFGTVCQLIWILFFWALSNVLWKRGLKRYVAVGG